MVAALHAVVERPRHVVAQVVEAELVVGAVGDVRLVGLAARCRGHLRGDDTNLHAQEPVDAAHGLGVAAGQVVVDGDHVDALTGERVEVNGECRGKRLTLTGFHLSDIAEMQRGAAHELHVEVPLPQGPLRRLAHGGESLGQQVV